jgi:hypothetical protein
MKAPKVQLLGSTKSTEMNAASKTLQNGLPFLQTVLALHRCVPDLVFYPHQMEYGAARQAGD